MSSAETNNGCAVVVTFKPDITALLTLLGQLDKEMDFVVIDNGTPDIETLAESITVYERCVDLLRLPENNGLAKALNVGLKWAQDSNRDYVFLFDQDSSLCDLFVNRMIAAYVSADEHSAKGIAAMGPRIINPQSMRQTPFKLFNRLILRSDQFFAQSKTHFLADVLITSGTMIILKHFAEIGGMKESYFTPSASAV
jgi:rhamnosyltransferase